MRGGEGNAAWQRCEERRILRLLVAAISWNDFTLVLPNRNIGH